MTKSESRTLTLAEARELAYRRIALREHGSKELEDLLFKRGVEASVASEIVADLVNIGAIDDERYTRVVARAQIARGKGPRYIRAKMRRKGVRVDLSKMIKVFKEVAPEDEVVMARRIVELRYADAATDLKVRQRAFRALLSRGFSMDVARKATAKSR